MDIDFVITWVDGNDPEWRAEKARYSGKSAGDDREKRYRDWEVLKYWFRGVEECAPWVRYIHFVTCGHLPAWLATDNPRLKIVKHSDYIPAQYLPTFSCRPIELNMHRIPGLSERFVYFNDDMFLLRPVTEELFFRNGLPCDTAICQASYMHGEDVNGEPLKPENYNTSNIYNMVPINRHFRKRDVIRANPGKWFSLRYGGDIFRTLLLMPWGAFTGFKSTHLPYSYLKKTFEEAWEMENALFDRACTHKVRDSTDISSRLLSFWQMAEGNFVPRSVKDGKYFSIRNDDACNRKMYRAIREKSYPMVCLNDEYSGPDFDTVKAELISCFEAAFPEKSSFEK